MVADVQSVQLHGQQSGSHSSESWITSFVLYPFRSQKQRSSTLLSMQLLTPGSVHGPPHTLHHMREKDGHKMWKVKEK